MKRRHPIVFLAMAALCLWVGAAAQDVGLMLAGGLLAVLDVIGRIWRPS